MTSHLSIPVARPLLGEEEVSAVRRVILSGWVTQGPEVQAFEREFAAFTGAPFACAVSSCTTALHLALRALGADSGSEVVTVSHSFIATANAIRYCGATPVFVDFDARTFNIDPARIEAALTRRTAAIPCVHQLGMPCDLPAVLDVAKRVGVPVIEDAACAAGSEIRWNGQWERIGRPRGDIACFSFHPRKLVTTGDGGMLTTSNPEWDAQFRRWRQHGMSLTDLARHGSDTVEHESYTDLGYNYRLTDIQAAIGREQLSRLPEVLVRRRQLAARYASLLAATGFEAPYEPDWARSNWQSFCVRLPARCGQQAVMQRMLDEGIATRRGVMCSHREPAYAGPVARTAGPLAESEKAQDECVLLPLFTQMTDADQAAVVDSLRRACLS